MRIEITNKNNVLTVDFGRWLCKRINFIIRSKLNRAKAKQWSDYLTESKLFETTFSDKILADILLLQGANSLVCKMFPELICIEVDKNIYAQGLNQVKLETVINLITFGNQEKEGYTLFKDVFEEVVENINDYVDKYIDGVHTWL